MKLKSFILINHKINIKIMNITIEIIEIIIIKEEEEEVDGEEKTLLDFMPSDMSADNFSKVEDMRVKINYLMKDLKPIEKEVICGLFGFGCREYTQYELSVKFKLTEERIRQIKFEALEKMREIA